MTAMLHDTSFVEDIDFVSIANGAQTMRYADGGTMLHQTLKGLLHQMLALCIQRTGGLIKNQDGRILEYGTCYAYALTLTSTETTATVAHHGLISLLGLHDEFMRIGYTNVISWEAGKDSLLPVFTALC